jgi:hypothetical protein
MSTAEKREINSKVLARLCFFMKLSSSWIDLRNEHRDMNPI